STRQGPVRQLDRAVRMDPAERRRVQGSERIPAGGVHLADLRAPVNQSEGIARLSMHHRDDLAEVRHGHTRRAQQIRRGIRGRPVAGSLRSYHDNRAGQVAQHETERRSREVKGVGAMRDDDAGRAGAEFLRHLQGEVLPVLRFQVLAEDAVDHPCPNVAHVEEFRDAEDEFLRRYRGMNGASAVVDVRGDRPSGAQDSDGGLATRRRREMSLDRAWCMLCRDLDRFDIAHRNADVVSVRQLDGQDILSAEARVRHEDALVMLALGADGDGIALVRLRAVQEGPNAWRVFHATSESAFPIWSLCREEEMPWVDSVSGWLGRPARSSTNCDGGDRTASRTRLSGIGIAAVRRGTALFTATRFSISSGATSRRRADVYRITRSSGSSSLERRCLIGSGCPASRAVRAGTT